jgi:hypothetical protein
VPAIRRDSPFDRSTAARRKIFPIADRRGAPNSATHLGCVDGSSIARDCAALSQEVCVVDAFTDFVVRFRTLECEHAALDSLLVASDATRCTVGRSPFRRVVRQRPAWMDESAQDPPPLVPES